MEKQFDDIMSRIRARQTEIGGGDEENRQENNVEKTEPPKIVKNDPIPPTTPVKVFGEQKTQQAENTLENSTFSPKKTNRFSMLAEDHGNFQCDFQNPYNKPKEAYMKGRSPRMSIGETRPSVLCVPGGIASKSPSSGGPGASRANLTSSGSSESPKPLDFESRRLKFAQPIANVNYLPNESSIFSSAASASDQSTVLGGSAEMMNVTTSSLSGTEVSMNQHITHENTVLNSQSCENRDAILRQIEEEESQREYGAHTFMRKKKEKTLSAGTPAVTTDFQFPKPSISTLVSSPKPFSKDHLGKSMFSPVHFTPKSTSSPKTSEVMSPSKIAALEASVTTMRRAQFEKQFNKSIPTPSKTVAVPPVPNPRHQASTPHVQHPAHQKTLFTTTTTTSKPPIVATAPVPVQTQWRGQANTPVVRGARAEDKTAGGEVKGPGVGRLNNLKSRWEFSSATGTPIHPDSTEDSLIATAKMMKETAIPNRIGHRSIHGRKGPSAVATVKSGPTSPEPKNLRYIDEEAPPEEPEVVDEEDVPIGESSGEEEGVGEDVLDADASRFIDNAFDFIGAGGATPSPYREKVIAEIVEEEQFSDPEDVPEELEDVQEPEVTTIESGRQKTPEKSADSSLAYSVSFYRKMQKERTGDASGTPLSVVRPSAPPMNLNLTSPQKLRQLTAKNQPRSLETMEREENERLIQEMRVEEQLVVQSKRAMALARDRPNFRGSREEFEAQRALLVHVEKHRALKTEYERFRSQGVRIIDGPRGKVKVTQLAIVLANDYVSTRIASSKKSEDIYYFVAVLRCGPHVDVSKMTTSDGGLNRQAVLQFPVPLRLTDIPSDFRATVEIYGQQSMREVTTHEDKFKLKGSTMKAKNVDNWCYYVDRGEHERRINESDDRRRRPLHHRFWRRLHGRNTFLGGGTSSSANTSVFGSLGVNSETSNFNLLGTFSFDINCPGKQNYSMLHSVYPLAGIAKMKVEKSAVDGVDVEFNGFLSMYQRTREGLGSWTRYWCVLENGEMKFWRHPEDEGVKGWLVLLDLATCCRSEGASIDTDTTPYPNSFHIDVWVPKEDFVQDASTVSSTTPQIEQLRVKLAADTNQDLMKWLSVINSTSRQLCTWRNPYKI